MLKASIEDSASDFPKETAEQSKRLHLGEKFDRSGEKFESMFDKNKKEIKNIFERIKK